MDLPIGSVTFLFTDIESSSCLWEQHPMTMGKAIARHDELLQAAVVKNRGHVVKMRGDGLHAVFASVHDAVAAAVDGQRALQVEEWDGNIVVSYTESEFISVNGVCYQRVGMVDKPITHIIENTYASCEECENSNYSSSSSSSYIDNWSSSSSSSSESS